MKKGLLIGAAVLVGGVILAVVFLASNLDKLVKEAVETYGSEITQAKVTLDKAEISATNGKGALKGLFVGNPQGFKTPSAFELGEVSVTLDTDSLTTDVIVIKEIVIAKPRITYELGAGGNNLDAIQRNVEAYLGAGKGQGGGAGGAEKSNDGAQKKQDGPKLVIENLYIRGGKVNVSATFLGGKKLGTPLPDMHLKDIGKEKKGASPGEVADKILGAVKSSATKAVGVLNLDKMMGAVTGGAASAAKAVTEGAAKAASEGAAKAGKSITEGASKAGEAVSKGLKDATGAIKGLFGGK